MEKVLDEIRVLQERILQLKQRQALCEDEISDEQFQRSSLEIKVHGLKQKQIQDGVKIESDLKNEFEVKKNELEELQERLTDVKAQLVLDQKRAEGHVVGGEFTVKESGKLGAGLNEIKELVTDIMTGTSAE